MQLRRLRWFIGMAGLAFGAFAARSSHAETSGKNTVAAQALYDEARKLVDAGNIEAACPKFRASYELDPGGGTLLNLADCYEKQGKLALAWSTFKEALVAAQRDGRTERIDFANQHIGKLEARLAHLTISVAANDRAAGLVIQIDGAALAEQAWGVAMPVDPGKHVVRAEAPGKQPFETTLDAAAGAAAGETVEIPTLADSTDDGVRGAAATAGASTATGDSGSGRTLGWVVGGIGVASLGVGGYFGLRAMSRWSDRDDGCAAGCTSEAKIAGDEAGTAATISTIGFGVGLIGIGVGTYLLLSSGGKTEPTPSVGSGVTWVPVATHDGAGLLLRSTW
jgi:hypothetical protein